MEVGVGSGAGEDEWGALAGSGLRYTYTGIMSGLVCARVGQAGGLAAGAELHCALLVCIVWCVVCGDGGTAGGGAGVRVMEEPGKHSELMPRGRVHEENYRCVEPWRGGGGQ